MRPRDDADAKNILRHLRVEPVMSIQTTDDMSIVALVKCGMECSILSRLLIDLFPKEYLNDLRMLPFEPMEYRILCLAHEMTAHLSPAVCRMKQHIIDFFRNVVPSTL